MYKEKFDDFGNRVAEVTVTLKPTVKPSERYVIQSSIDCYNLIMKYFNEDTIELHEEFWAMYLSRGNKVLGVYKVSKGSAVGTVVDLKQIINVQEVIKTMLKLNSCSIVLFHNHPSGNLKPSESDIKLTKQIKDACNVMESNLVDHLIVTREGYYSFADEGII